MHTRIATRTLTLLALLLGASACAGDGGDAGITGTTVDCPALERWRQGESATYRFTDASEDWRVTVTILELRPGFLKYEIREEDVGSGARSSSTPELAWAEGECPPFVTTPVQGDRERLVFGEPSAWGTFRPTRSGQPPETQSCVPATRVTAAGDFPVERCRKHGALGTQEPIDDDTFSGAGAAPGGGFIARAVSGPGGDALAVVEAWNGL
jgi:hypothetical protein